MSGKREAHFGKVLGRWKTEWSQGHPGRSLQCNVRSGRFHFRPVVHGSRYEQDVEQFKRKVHACVQHCKKRIYDNPDSDDPHAFR